MSASTTDSRYRLWLVALLLANYTSSFVDRVIVGVVGQAMIRELGLSDFQFGLLGGLAFALFFSIFGVPLAVLSERTSRTKLLAASVALWSVMTMLCGVAQTYGQLLLLRMGVGLGEAGCTPVAHSLISDSFKREQRGAALGVYSLGPPLGILVGSIAGGWIAANHGWRSAFLLLGAPGLGLALLNWFTLREPARDRSATAGLSGLAHGKASLTALLRQPSFRHLCLGLTMTTLAANSIGLFTPAYLVRAFGLGQSEVGIAYGLVTGISGMAGTLLGGFGVDRISRADVRWYAWLPAMGSVIAAPVYVIAFSRASVEAALAWMLSGSLCVALTFAPVFAAVQNLVGPGQRAVASAVVLLCMNVAGQGVGPALIGGLSDAVARARFGGGDYAARCLIAARPGFGADGCSQAALSGLRFAIVSMTVFFLWGALRYAKAARSMQDLAEPAISPSGA